MKLIDKAAVVAEIEKRIKINKGCMLGLRNLDYYQGKVDALNDTISFLDTLEVKEVDLEKEIEEHVVDMPMSEFTHESEVDDYWDWARKEFRHFFELGLKAKDK